MKKVYFLLCLMMFFAYTGTRGQVLIVEDFENGLQLADFPGWTTGLPPLGVNQTNPCEGLQSLRVNMFSGNPSAFLEYTSQVAGGQDIEVSFDYKLIDVATGNPVTGDFGLIDLSYSVDNGNTWTVYDSIDQSDLPTSNCSTHTFTIPLASVPTGSDFGWRLDITYNNTPLGAGGDYFLYIDDFKAVEQVGCIPPVNITVDPNSIGLMGPLFPGTT